MLAEDTLGESSAAVRYCHLQALNTQPAQEPQAAGSASVTAPAAATEPSQITDCNIKASAGAKTNFLIDFF